MDSTGNKNISTLNFGATQPFQLNQKFHIPVPPPSLKFSGALSPELREVLRDPYYISSNNINVKMFTKKKGHRHLSSV